MAKKKATKRSAVSGQQSAKKRTPPKPTADKKGPGRPEGAKTGNYDQAEVTATQCPKCGSSEREPYFGVVERPIAGTHNGQPHTHVVWRRTKCANCGQLRKDRCYENRLAAKLA